MGIIKAFTDSIGGTLADQWKEIITAGNFNEHIVVAPGVYKESNKGRGANLKASDGVITSGSKIFIPENTAAFIFSSSGIEEIITTPGSYEYKNGQHSIFNGDGVTNSILDQVKERISFGGQTSEEKKIAFVNLREIRDIKFGTRGPVIYNDMFYDADLEIQAYGTFSIKVTDSVKFIRNYVPANVNFYSFDDPKVRTQIIAEFIQSFTVALNSLSTTYRISQLHSQANHIVENIYLDNSNAGTWKERFGFEIVQVAIENIEFSPESRELVKQYNTNKFSVKAYEDVSQKASNIAAQQKIAKGIQDNGLGDGAGMLFGINVGQNINPQTAAPIVQNSNMSIDEQIENLKKLKELVDMGILSEEEFALKKKEIMGL